MFITSTTSPHPRRHDTPRTPASTRGAGPAIPEGLRGWVARRPLSAFLGLVFGLTYPIVGVLILATHGVLPGGSLAAALPIPADELAGLIMAMILFPAAMTVTWAADGRRGVRRLLHRMVRWRVGVGWWLVALAGLPVLTVGFALLLGDSVRSIDPVEVFVSQLGFLAVNFILVNIWEEAAWAGFLQTRLERRHNIVVAALITAVPFGFLHWPLAFFGDFTTASVSLGLVLYILLGVIFRPMLGVLLRGSRDSVLLVAVTHSIFNRTNNDNGIAAGILTGDLRAIAILPAVIVLTAVAAVVIRRRLSRAHRLQLDVGSGASPSTATAGHGDQPRNTLMELT